MIKSIHFCQSIYNTFRYRSLSFYIEFCSVFKTHIQYSAWNTYLSCSSIILIFGIMFKVGYEVPIDISTWLPWHCSRRSMPMPSAPGSQGQWKQRLRWREETFKSFCFSLAKASPCKSKLYIRGSRKKGHCMHKHESPKCLIWKSQERSKKQWAEWAA